LQYPRGDTLPDAKKGGVFAQRYLTPSRRATQINFRYGLAAPLRFGNHCAPKVKSRNWFSVAHLLKGLRPRPPQASGRGPFYFGPPQLAASFNLSACGTSRHFAAPQNSVAIGCIADIHRPLFTFRILWVHALGAQKRNSVLPPKYALIRGITLDYEERICFAVSLPPPRFS
jgi:hypothetical protein